MLIGSRHGLICARLRRSRLLIIHRRRLLVGALLRCRHLQVIRRRRLVGARLRRWRLLIIDGRRLLVGALLWCRRLLVVHGPRLIGTRNHRLPRSIAEHGLDETVVAVSGLARISELPTGIERLTAGVGAGRDHEAGGASRQRGRYEYTSKDTPHH